MGRQRTSRRKTSKTKEYKRSFKTANRSKDVDEVQDDIAREEAQGHKTVFELDDDLPGLGQFYCTPCAKHFSDEQALEAHYKAKAHKRRLKDVAEQKYTHEEAERGAGRSKEVLPPVSR
mmetsp:Transcript_113/g.214  ORF Transcript_113/g.214 Transcript_113/m.214 type:complete len:119 (-) Transcript_113:359-715(-)